MTTHHTLPIPDGPARAYDLSRRDITVLAEMAMGRSDTEIAEALGLSNHIVHKHVVAILHKMGTPSRTVAAVRALKERIVP